MTSDDEPAASLVLTITPEPTVDERDAIVAALIVLRNRRRPSDGPLIQPEPTRWQRTARREAVQAGSTNRDWR